MHLKVDHLDKPKLKDEMVECHKRGGAPLKDISRAKRSVEKGEKPLDLTKVFVGLKKKRKKSKPG